MQGHPRWMRRSEEFWQNMAEPRRIGAFKPWCWRRLESPLDCKEIEPVRPKGNQLWIFIGRTDAEAEAPVLWPPDVKSQLIEKDPDAGKDKDNRGRGQHRMRWLSNITDSMDMNLSQLWETVKDTATWCAAVHGITESRACLSNWTTTCSYIIKLQNAC